MEIYDVKNKSRETQIPSLVFVGNLMVFIFFAFLYQFKSCFSKVFLVTENQELLSHVHLDLSPPTKKKNKQLPLCTIITLLILLRVKQIFLPFILLILLLFESSTFFLPFPLLDIEQC